MYISKAAVPISEREHIARLYRIIARDIEDCDAKFLGASETDWDTVLTPLHVASSIESLSANTSYVDDTHALDYCSTVADFEDAHSELMSQYIKELTVFAWVWLAFEKIIDALCTVHRGGRTERAIAFIRAEVGAIRLPGLKNIEQRICELAPTTVHEKAIKAAKSEPSFLFVHLCREARNHILHGDTAIPNPQDMEDCIESERDSHVIFVCGLTQLVLFAIQTLLFAAFQDAEHRTATIMESRGVPKDILVQDALRILHLDEKDYDQRQSEFNFGTRAIDDSVEPQ